ncbi:hypothetical protein [Nonomuraea jabiensis]
MPTRRAAGGVARPRGDGHAVPSHHNVPAGMAAGGVFAAVVTELVLLQLA